METKISKMFDKLDELTESFKDEEALIGLYVNNTDKKVVSHQMVLSKNIRLLSVASAVALEHAYKGTATELEQKLVEYITRTVNLFITLNHDEASVLFLLDMMNEAIGGVEEDCADSCEDCIWLTECDDECAIAARKKLGIPKPRKDKKRNRKEKGGK